MTYAADNRAWLEPYILDIARRMGVLHWKVELIDEAPDDDSRAQVWLREKSLWARILIHEPETLADLRESVVHELMHIHLHNLEGVFKDIKDHLGPLIWHVIDKRHDTELEQAVATMTRAWAPLLPMPEPANQEDE